MGILLESWFEALYAFRNYSILSVSAAKKRILLMAFNGKDESMFI